MDFTYCENVEAGWEGIYCPCSDIKITEFSREKLSEHSAIVAWFHDDAIEPPIIFDPKLEKEWNSYHQNWKEKDNKKRYYEIIVDFLYEYENPDWIVHEITIEGMACGPVSDTDYLVVKKESLDMERCSDV